MGFHFSITSGLLGFRIKIKLVLYTIFDCCYVMLARDISSDYWFG